MRPHCQNKIQDLNEKRNPKRKQEHLLKRKYKETIQLERREKFKTRKHSKNKERI